MAATVPPPLHLPCRMVGVGGVHLKVMSLLLQVPEGRAAYLTLGASDILRTMTETTTETTTATETTAAERGRTRRRRRRQVPIVHPYHPPVPGDDSRVPSPSEARSDEGRTGVSSHISGHGVVEGLGGG